MNEKKYNDVFLSLGANIGDRVSSLNNAIELLETRCGNIVQKSHIYESEAWGFKSKNLFLNMCIEINSKLSISAFAAEIQIIEKILGRIKKHENNIYSDRLIDIDIIFFDSEIINSPNLTIPHPRMHKRRFVLVPLAEIAAEKIHPVFKKTTSELLRECSDVSKLNVYLG